MVLEEKPVPVKNKPWIYLGAAFVFLAMYFGFGKLPKGKGSKLKALSAKGNFRKISWRSLKRWM